MAFAKTIFSFPKCHFKNHLGMLAFGQEERGKGYGTEFLHFYENYCKKIGCQAVNLEVLSKKSISFSKR